MEYIVLTGMSGSGKSQASHTLEDMGFYCIDNMPVALIPILAELYAQTPGKTSKVAFIIDVRGEIEFHSLLEQLDELKKKDYRVSTVFIDCSDAVLVNRFKETRRVHPLVKLNSVSLEEALTLERAMLEPVRENADFVIDTSALTPNQLREKIIGIVNRKEKDKLFVTCMSFGFKYGITTEADLVFDVRCFLNPYYIPELKNLTGKDKEVRDYVFSSKQTTDFVGKLYDMIDFLIPLYVEEGKSMLTIAIGCTGGKHRSVAIAEALGAHLKERGVNTLVLHRDIVKKFVGDK